MGIDAPRHVTILRHSETRSLRENTGGKPGIVSWYEYRD
jgi:hypothetical protein